MAEIRFNINQSAWDKLLQNIRDLTGATQDQEKATEALNEEFEELETATDDLADSTETTAGTMSELEKIIRQNIAATRGLTEDLGSGAVKALDDVESSTQSLIRATEQSADEFGAMQAAANVFGDIQNSAESLEAEFVKLQQRLGELQKRTNVTDDEILQFADDADALASETRELQKEIKSANTAMQTMADVADDQTTAALEEFSKETDRLNKRLGALAKETKSVSREAKDLGENTSFVGKIAGEVERRVGGLGGELSALVGAGGPMTLAIGAAVGFATALFKITQSAKETVAEISKLSRQTGLSLEQISKIQALAKLAGVQVETLADAFGDLSERALKAATGQSREYLDAFNALNVELKTASGALRPVNEIFLDLQRGLSLVADTTTRAGLAQTLLGGQANALANILGRTAGEVAALNKEAEAFATDVSPETVEAFERLDREASKLSLSLQKAFLPIGEFTVRGLTALIETMKSGAGAGLNLATAMKFVSELTKQYNVETKKATNTGQQYSVMLGGVEVSARKYTDAEKKAIEETERLNRAWRNAEKAVAFVPEFRDSLGGVVRVLDRAATSKGLGNVYTNLVRLPPITEMIKVDLQETAAIQFNGVERLLAGLAQSQLFAVNLTNALLNIAQTFQQSIADGLFDAATGVRSLNGALEQVGRTLRDVILRTLTEIAAKAAFRGLLALIPGGGAIAAIGGSFLGFAHGGIVTEPTLAVVGERGPERITPLAHPSPEGERGLGMTNNVSLSFNVSGVLDGIGFEQIVERRIIPMINTAVARGVTVQATRFAR